MEAVASRIAPTVEQRLGLGYVDRVSEPKVASPDEWKEYITEPFLGPVMHPTVGRSVRNSRQQILDGAEALHDLNVQLFQQAVTPMLLEALA